MTSMTATQPEKSSWVVCDTVTKAFGAGAPEPVTVTVVDGQPDLNEHRRVLDKPDGVLLRFGGDVWLIRDGRRSLVDASERSVLLALGVTADELAAARPMSQALLNAIPVAPPLVLPVIPGAGGPALFSGAPGPVGMVVSTPQVGGDSTYSVVVPTGMQTISPIVAQILQNAGGMAGTIPVVAGQVLSALPTVHVIDTSIYPDERLRVVDTQDEPVDVLVVAEDHRGAPGPDVGDFGGVGAGALRTHGCGGDDGQRHQGPGPGQRGLSAARLRQLRGQYGQRSGGRDE